MKDEENIADSFFANKTLKNINWSDLYRKGFQFLKILKFFNTESQNPYETKQLDFDFIKIADTLHHVFTTLNHFRNDYTHYYSSENNWSRKTTVSTTVAQFLTDSFKEAIAFSKKRYAEILDEKDYNLVEQKR